MSNEIKKTREYDHVPETEHFTLYIGQEAIYVKDKKTRTSLRIKNAKMAEELQEIAGELWSFMQSYFPKLCE